VTPPQLGSIVEGQGNLLHSLQCLFDEGRMVLQSAATHTSQELREAEGVLAEFDRRYRLELPGEAPGLSAAAATWAAEMFIRACQCLVFREIDEAGVNERLSPRLNGKLDASAHYSVDLTFRLLPDLYHRAEAASRHDPLLTRLKEWADEWPLSSVGIAGSTPKQLDAILEHPSLRILYADRIIARKDIGRLNDPRARAAVLGAIGLHEELAPEVVRAAKAFTKKDTDMDADKN
jgi:MoxR-vWA-beta-propeller ternary system domain bpX4